MGRNTLNSPGIIGWDFSMLKDFNFTERHRLQFRFEAFNFPNHPNWGNPNTNIASGGNFGADHRHAQQHAQSAVRAEVLF